MISYRPALSCANRNDNPGVQIALWGVCHPERPQGAEGSTAKLRTCHREPVNAAGKTDGKSARRDQIFRRTVEDAGPYNGALNSNFAFLCIRDKKGIYIFCIIVYDKREQSRKPRVKCRQNGELSDGRRILSAMRLPHPLPIQDDLLYVATILGRANGRLIVLSCPKGEC